MRVRKTVDTWEIHVSYGDGWEHECTEFSWKNALETRKQYFDAGHHCTKIVRRRMKIADMTASDLMDVDMAAYKAKEAKNESAKDS